jgi:DNA-binding HxlR family transcriptional regulator
MNKIKTLESCPVYRTAEILDGKWTILIFRDLLAGPVRFNELKKSIGTISPKTLSDRLKLLEELGLITRSAYAEVPPRVEYELTEKGRAINPVFEQMAAYGQKWL